VSILLEGLAGQLNEQQAEYLGYAKESCDQLVRHLSDLLDVARLETGKLQIEIKETQAQSIVDSVIAAKRITAKQAGISLLKDIAPNLPTLLVDPHRIHQILTNLVDNAIKFTPSGGCVTVRACSGPEPGDQVTVAVCDTGRGIPGDKLERIFDRLCQVVESDANERQGLGLGLNICKELIGLHHGEIWAESTLGQGSTIHFSLPVAAAAG
jgi:signal transduction histidine kinase